MTERYFQIGDDSVLDEHFRLHYRNETRILNPCEVINDGSLEIGLIDNNNLNPKRLLLTEADYQPVKVMIPKTGDIVTLSYPGKSGLLHLEDSLDGNKFRNIAMRFLGRGADRRDHLHVASLRNIESVGWKVYWAPLQMSGHLHHVRLASPNSMFGNPISEDEAAKLVNVFKKHC